MHSRRQNSWSVGSSPRVRGTPHPEGAAVGCCRFIPACAGNSLGKLAFGLPDAVHPRVCGELGTSTSLMLYPNGSSPRVRGTHRRRRGDDQRHRFIPACAGNSIATLDDHDLICGSSPRVRGTLPREPPRAGGRRFIPACAGNSELSYSRFDATPVHPRVCGELCAQLGGVLVGGGSSPRVRGTRPPRSATSHPCRFIPACAGNSTWRCVG